MVERTKGFKIDDKVFGKVKGYPAWPARIASINGKRYGVVFYGTNETATLKQDDIFYYLSNKHKINKQKRRFYAEAITDIELDIAKCGGSDGNENPQNGSNQEEPTLPKANKRKRASMVAGKKPQETPPPSNKRRKLEDQNHNLNDISSENNFTTAINENATPMIKQTQSKLDKFIITKIPNQEAQGVNMVQGESWDNAERQVEVDPTTSADATNDAPDGSQEMKFEDDKQDGTVDEVPENETHSAIVNHTDDIQDIGQTVGASEECEPEENPYYTGQLTVENVNLLPDFYLTAIRIYAERVQENNHHYKISRPDAVSLDDESDARLKVLPVRIDADRFCGLIFTPKPLESYRCEYDRAMGDAKIVEELLELKAEIDVGNLELNDHRFIRHLDCDGAYVRHTTNSSIVAYKKSKLNWLQNEMEAFKTLVEIKRCLGLQEARAQEAIAHMGNLLNCKLDAISLKKRSFFVETVHRLGRYVGNAKDWNLGEEQLAQFEENAAKIREMAEEIMTKIRGLFDFGSEADAFLERFEKECEVFNQSTKSLSEAEVFSLCAEPLSRKAQLELIFDEQANNQDSVDVAEGGEDPSNAWYTPD